MLPTQASLVILRLRVLWGRGQQIFHDQENDSEEEDVGEEAEEEEVESLDGLHAEVGLSLVSTLHSSIVLKYKSVAEAYTTQPNSKASSRVLYMYFSCMAG
jgi:hypothetical protein